MSFKFKALAAVAVACFSMVSSQPTACTEDSQCSSGFYCEESAHYCRECLRCGELKREAPQPRELCVKSVLQCGECFKGLVEDLRLDRACMSPAMQPVEVLPTYAWAIIGLMVLGVLLIVIILIVFKKDTIFQHILKIRATTSASACNGVPAAPSAPEMAPPPYEAVYERAASPDPPDPSTMHVFDEEVSKPFIKRLPSARAHGARESAGSQAAQPFNNPAYIRGPAPSFVSSDESEPGSPFPPQDEETMDSLWTPNENPADHNISDANGNLAAVSESAGAAAAAAAGAGAARRRGSGDAGPPSKALCLREDTNNNRGAAPGGPGGPGGPGAAGPSVLINVVTNFNSFEQRNNVNLPNHYNH